MLPTLKSGQDVLIWCWFNSYKVGDIVVIQKNGKEMVKRVQKVYDPASPKLRGASREYFVQGDNEQESTDSRHFGPIKKTEIVGKVIWY